MIKTIIHIMGQSFNRLFLKPFQILIYRIDLMGKSGFPGHGYIVYKLTGNQFTDKADLFITPEPKLYLYYLSLQ